MSQASHCPACATEFVAGVARCSDCGGPLTPGELPAASGPSPYDDSASAIPGLPPMAAATAIPDRLLCTVPGEEAETIASALTFEGITSRLVCDGLQRLRGPGQQASGPMSKRRPVEMYVLDEDFAEAEAVLESLDGHDLIGEQWLEDGETATAPAARTPFADVAETTADTPRLDESAAASQSTRGVWLAVAALLALIGFFLALL